MKTALFSLVFASAALVGCGGGGGTTTTSDTTTDPSGTSTAPPGTTSETGATATTSPTTGADETTSPPVTSTTEDPATSATLPTTETEPGTSTTGETTGATGTTAAETTGEPPDGGKCKEDTDCTLISDCCRCAAIAVGDPIPECPMMECFAPLCDTLGIDAVQCRLGTCVTEKLNCDASMIACDSLPPECPKGSLPGVNEDNICWTGGCVPTELCNFVSGCADCSQDTMCVVDETLPGPKYRCEPIPEACMGQPTCACAGEACDTPPYDLCSEQPAGLYCSCPNC